MKYIVISSLLLLTIAGSAPLVQAVCNSGSLTQVSGSPFTAGTGPRFATYSPLVNGNLWAAVANTNNISVYSANQSTGVFTQITGSPFATGFAAGSPRGIAYSPVIGKQLFAAVASFSSDNAVGIYVVDPNSGAFGTPTVTVTASGSVPYGVAFSPVIEGSFYLAVANSGTANVSVYQVNALTGALTQVPGSPFTAGTTPRVVAFSPLINGNLFAAVVNNGSNNVSVYQVNTSTGVFAAVTGSPFAVGSSPSGVTFTPLLGNNLFAAVPNQTSATISVFQVNTSTGAFSTVSGSPFAAVTDVNSVAFTPLLGGNLYAIVPDSLNTILVYPVNTSTGTFGSQVSGSPFSITGLNGPFGGVCSPYVSGGVFAAAANLNGNNVSVVQVATLLPALTTLSQYILNGSSVTINGTISGGTEPYSVTWQDSVVQSGISTNTFSRTVSPTASTVYYVSTITDTNGCSAGPSNLVTIGVRTCP